MQKQPEIQFIFEELKAIQASYHLLMLSQGILPDYTLLRLLYFADRIMLLTKHWTITGDQPILNHNGVFLLNIQKLLNNKNSSFSPYIKNAQGCLNANRTNPPGDSELSNYEKYILNFVHTAFRLVPDGYYYQNLLPEYQFFLPSSDTEEPFLVDPAYILRTAGTVVGLSSNHEEIIQEIKNDIEEHKFFNSLSDK